MRKAGIVIVSILCAPLYTSGQDARPQTPEPATSAAARPASEKAAVRTKVFVGGVSGKVHPTAALLTSTEAPADYAEGLEKLIAARGFHVITITNSPEGWQTTSGEEIVSLIDKAAKKVITSRRFLLVAMRHGGAVAMEVIDGSCERLLGAVLISVVPVSRTPEGIDLWAPRGKAWGLSIWAVVGTNTADAAQTLLMWRRIASVAPAEALLTVDTRLGKGAGEIQPDDAIARWLDDLAVGGKPRLGRDRQVENERKLFGPFVEALEDAMKDVPAAKPGRQFSKRERPMEIGIVAPEGWMRYEHGERAFKAEESPYVQIYLTPAAKGPLFARAIAAEWSGTAAALLDDYNSRLAHKGFLVIRYKQWKVGDKVMEMSSILWPTRDRWHRWLVLACAGPGRKAEPAAPLLLVMDASAKPNTAAMAAAAERMMGSIRLRWIGGATAKPESPAAGRQSVPPAEQSR